MARKVQFKDFVCSSCLWRFSTAEALKGHVCEAVSDTVENTILEKSGQRLMLHHRDGRVLLDLSGPTLDGAVREGLIDPANLHYSMWEHWLLKKAVDEIPRGRFKEWLDGKDPVVELWSRR